MPACACMCSQEYKSEKWQTMWYKSTDSVGVRRSAAGDKKQIFQFGGSKCVLEKEQLMGFGEDCLRKLDAGVAEADVKEWVKDAISA